MFRQGHLHSGKRLIDIGNDIVWVLDADRKPDVSLRDAGLELLFWRQLRVRCGRRMDGERAGITDVGDMIEELQVIYEPTASLFAALELEAKQCAIAALQIGISAAFAFALH